ncbi:MAG: bacteriohemerythrin [Syntrophobacteraceae bacterium]
MNFGSRTNQTKIMEWKDSYSVGVEEIDLQHRKLLDLINELYSLHNKEATGQTCFAFLNGMMKYAQMHFDTEEHYFEKSGYPDLVQHKRSHEEFVEETFAMTQDLDEDMLTLGGITIYLQEWYKDHVLGLDQDYKPFLEKTSGIPDEVVVVPPAKAD